MSVTGPALLLAALLPAAPAEPGPTCRAELDGAQLTTTIAFADGYAIEGPWTVLHTKYDQRESEAAMIVIDASLDRVVEEDAIIGSRKVTPLVRSVTVSFEAPSEPELVYEAARTWCQTVLRARGPQSAPHGPALPRAGRLT